MTAARRSAGPAGPIESPPDLPPEETPASPPELPEHAPERPAPEPPGVPQPRDAAVVRRVRDRTGGA